MVQQLRWPAPLSSPDVVPLGPDFGTMRVANPGGQQRALFVCTYGFEEFARHLGPNQPLYGICMPKDHRIEALNPRTGIRQLAAHYLGPILAAQPEGPLLIFGYADGGILAYELAQQLLECDREVAFLGMYDVPRPGPPQPRSLIARMRDHLTALQSLPRAARGPYVRRRIDNMLVKLAARFPRLWRPASSPSDPAKVRTTARPMGDLRSAIVWLRIMRHYRPRAYPGRLTLILGQDSPAFFGLGAGWRELATGGADIVFLPGDHCDNLSEPLVGTTAKVIAEAIRGSDGGSRAGRLTAPGARGTSEHRTAKPGAFATPLTEAAVPNGCNAFAVAAGCGVVHSPTGATERVTLGRSGVIVSLIGMGTGTLTSAQASSQTRQGIKRFTEVVRHALDRGICFFDVADLYGSHAYLREALKGVPRERYVIQTKTRAARFADARSNVERYRMELGVEMIDIILLHGVDKAGWPASHAGAIDYLMKAKEEGIIRAHGTSCHGMEPLRISAGHPFVEIDLARINPEGLMMDDRNPEEVAPLLAQMHDAGKGVIGMKIFGEGRMQQAERRDASLRYVLGLEAVDALIIGFESTDQIDDTLSRADKALEERHSMGTTASDPR